MKIQKIVNYDVDIEKIKAYYSNEEIAFTRIERVEILNLVSLFEEGLFSDCYSLILGWDANMKELLICDVWNFLNDYVISYQGSKSISNVIESRTEFKVIDE